MNSQVKKALDEIVDLFKSGNIGEKIEIATFPPYDVPCSKWSLANQLLCLMRGPLDVRGIRQWNKGGHRVIKRCQSIRILLPCLKKEIEKVTGEEVVVLVGLKTVLKRAAVAEFRLLRLRTLLCEQAGWARD